ncbi:hypothetical protein LTS14_001739 [Recurvomyces mirabilis]|uniref:uncharacterized protein n=1 Tax=Recurvomyces mirabilis TaxID=574656 RepID=UPI002DDE56AD|nr:hypothetical protein LTS14_001739 [Recurvomyces mirabilis]
MDKLNANMDGTRFDSGRNTSGEDNDESSIEESVGIIEGSALGYGLFALHDIRKGTCLLEEDALVIVRSLSGESRLERCTRIFTMINDLSSKKLDLYSSLHYEIQTLDAESRDYVRRYLIRKQYTPVTLPAALLDHLKLLAIFKTNSVGSKTGTGVFATYSRINHSCTPNIDNSHIDDHELLYAIRDIKAGEEITTSYIDGLTFPKAWRAKTLARWHFVCKCAACAGPQAVEHARRRSMIAQGFVELDQGMREPTNIATSHSKQSHDKLNQAESVAQLCIEEGLVGTDLSRAYRLCSECALVVGQPLKAIEYARQAYEVEVICVGPRIKTKDTVQTWLHQLEALVVEKPRRARHEIEKRRKAAEKIEHEALKRSKKIVDEEAVARQNREAEELEKGAEQRRARQGEMAARVAESNRVAGEEARMEEKRVKEVERTAAKKARRFIRLKGAEAGMDVEKVEALAAQLKGDELIELASGLAEVEDVAKVKILFEQRLQSMLGCEANA